MQLLTCLHESDYYDFEKLKNDSLKINSSVSNISFSNRNLFKITSTLCQTFWFSDIEDGDINYGDDESLKSLQTLDFQYHHQLWQT